MEENNWKNGTKCVQSGYRPKAGEARILPLYQSTTFFYDDANHVAELFDLKAAGHFYSRLSNPTCEGLEQKIAALEGGVGALAVSSGQSACMYSILNICRSGQHIVAASTLYGGTYTLLAGTLKQMGIEVSFVDPEAGDDEILAAFRPETRALYGETIGNPGLNVLDFDKFSRIARQADVPLIIDNTFGTPYLCRPLELGADIVLHSSTKYLDGHATSLGGIIVDGGKYNWDNGKYPELSQPDASYHGMCYTEAFGPAAYITKARVHLLRDMGNCMSPFNAFLTNLGAETLHLRMRRHCDNALALAEWLERQEAVAWVNYPGLPGHPSYERAQRYLPQGASGVITFGLKRGAEAGKRFINRVKLAALVVHVGDARSCVLHPASTTHRQLSEEEQIASGVRPEMVRVSVGIEDVEDIIADFAQALGEANSTGKKPLFRPLTL
ncbi:MAG: O-acetylhomoserine aminocarboxypropyltransferase/cysteine synthase [Syntrophomonadaceae bacterium]|nr:O-acetylhomoserine aminocarboxypropyltransferase/cysteine synthase [Syntrophomonadaceae bacterium]